MFHNLVPRELFTEVMEFLFIRDGLYICECKISFSTLLPAALIQGIRKASQILHCFPHCKVCLSYVIVPETQKSQKTLITLSVL